MRVLVDATSYDGELRGIPRFLQKLLPEMARESDVSVLASVDDIFRAEGLRVLPAPESTRTVTRRFLWQLLQLRRHCQGFDILVCPTPFCMPRPPIPVLTVVHDPTPVTMSDMHCLRYRTVFRLSVATVKWADAVVAVSHHTKNDVISLRLSAAERTHVVHEGPGVGMLPSEGESARRYSPYILNVGGHWTHKNTVRLVRAFSQIRHSQELRLVMVGGGDPGPTLQEAQRLGVDKRLILLRSVSDIELSALYSCCRAVVQPSLYEGFGLPVLEAMIHGAPVACSSTSSLPEVAGDAAFIFDALSPGQIAAAMQTILDNPGVAADLAERGRRRASQFSWRRCATEFTRIARSCVEERSRVSDTQPQTGSRR